jgi:glycosyltransferase involved in cell wall biosynthesis
MTETLKILEVTTSYPRYKGDNFSVFIHKKVKALNNQGIRNDVLVPRDSSIHSKNGFDNIRVYRFTYFFHKKLHRLTYNYGVPENFKRSVLAKIQVPFLILAFIIKTFQYGKKYDIIHANWAIAGVGGLIAAKLLNRKFILTMHGAEVFKLKKHFLLGFLLKSTPNIITNSHYTCETIKKLYNLPEKKFSVLPFGVDDNAVASNYRDPLFWNYKFDIPPNARVIFSLGRLIERKGFIYLLKAFKILEAKYDDLYLVIGGDGPEKPRLMQFISDNNIKKVHLLDFIEDRQLPYFYANAFCFVLPSVVDSEGDTEGLGIVNIEALNYETPVISTNVGGIGDVVINRETGLLVREKSPEGIVQAAEELMNNEWMYRKLQKQGKDYVAVNFIWNSIARKYIEYYKNH